MGDCMGRKVHPYGFRLGYIKDWKARWYAEKDEYADLLAEDLKLRKLIRDELGHAGISTIEIERFPRARHVSVKIWTAKPGIVIGRKGVNVNARKPSHLVGSRLRCAPLGVSRASRPRVTRPSWPRPSCSAAGPAAGRAVKPLGPPGGMGATPTTQPAFS